jgi:hypothetical protein
VSQESSPAELLPAAALADCAGGILSAVEASSGGRAAGEMLAAEPELLLAATRRGELGWGEGCAGGQLHQHQQLSMCAKLSSNRC